MIATDEDLEGCDDQQASLRQQELDEAARLLAIGKAPRYADATGTMIVEHVEELAYAQCHGVRAALARWGH